MIIEDGHLAKTSRRRIRVVRINPRRLLNMFKEGLFLECINGIPEGTSVSGVYYDHNKDSWDLCLHNIEFEEVEEGMAPPEHTIAYKSYWGPELQITRRLIKDLKKAQEQPLEEIL